MNKGFIIRVFSILLAAAIALSITASSFVTASENVDNEKKSTEYIIIDENDDHDNHNRPNCDDDPKGITIKIF